LIIWLWRGAVVLQETEPEAAGPEGSVLEQALPLQQALTTPLLSALVVLAVLVTQTLPQRKMAATHLLLVVQAHHHLHPQASYPLVVEEAIQQDKQAAMAGQAVGVEVLGVVAPEIHQTNLQQVVMERLLLPIKASMLEAALCHQTSLEVGVEALAVLALLVALTVEMVG